MRFGIFYEHQLPRPWAEGDEERLLRDALDQVALADRLGYDSVWEVEHHFLEEYAHSSAPGVFLAACSQRTERIRLGFGILPLPPGYQHPARVAETVATLDLVSGGRVEFGTGETSSGAELDGFGVARETKREAWDEALDVVTRMMVEEPFAGWEGRWVHMPPRNVVPKPRQKPHPPVWVACSRRETILLAAEKGIGALSFSFVEPEQAKEWIDEYYAILGSERCVPAGFAVNPNVAIVLPMMCHPDEATAIERGIDGAHFFGYSLAHYYVFGHHHPGRTNIWKEFQRRREETGFARGIITAEKAPLGLKIMQEGFGSLRGAIGTPEQVRDLLRRYEAAGVDEVIFISQSGRTRHEHICESLELVAREVLPEFHERRDERERVKAQRLAGGVATALARRTPARVADSDYVIAPSAGGGGQAPAAPAESPAPGRLAAARGRLSDRGEHAVAAWVRRADDRRLERVVGAGPALRLVFGEMARRFQPERANGFTGDIVYELRTREGRTRPWTISVADGRASARPGAVADPRLRVVVGVADFARIATRELEPGAALLTGRLDFHGDFAVAARLGEMFGEPSPY
jgi:alkanesulfonate monooxygenase SsuD/methylene tetrahydromethanopterin reductase-like flavin-dependent oxidoreductase (luciferase family)